MDSKMTQGQVLAECFKLCLEKGVCPKTEPKEWIKLLLYLHSKGWLYISHEKDKVVMTAAMYRIPDVKPEYVDVLPKEETGKILYVPFFASQSSNNMLAKKMLTQYLSKHQEIDEIAFYERGDDNKLKRFKRRSYQNGKKENA